MVVLLARGCGRTRRAWAVVCGDSQAERRVAIARTGRGNRLQVAVAGATPVRGTVGARRHNRRRPPGRRARNAAGVRRSGQQGYGNQHPSQPAVLTPQLPPNGPRRRLSRARYVHRTGRLARRCHGAEVAPTREALHTVWQGIPAHSWTASHRAARAFAQPRLKWRSDDAVVVCVSSSTPRATTKTIRSRLAVLQRRLCSSSCRS